MSEAHPAATAADWLANAHDAWTAVCHQVDILTQMPSAYGLNTMEVSGLCLAGGIALLKIARNVPGVTGLAAGLVETVVKQFAPDEHKAALKDQAVAAQGFHALVSTIEACDNDHTLEDLKSALKKRLPVQVKAAIEAYTQQLPERIPDPDPVDPVEVTTPIVRRPTDPSLKG